MSLFYKRIKFIILVLFIPSTVFTSIVLFGLQNDLIINIPQLNTGDIPGLAVVLANLHIAFGITLILGLVSLLLNFVANKETILDENTNTQTKFSKKETKNTEEDVQIEDIDLTQIIDLSKKYKEKSELYNKMLASICNQIEAGLGALYFIKDTKKAKSVELHTAYALNLPSDGTVSFKLGEGLVGQVAQEGITFNIDDVPDNYINIVSGLGSASPNHLFIAPIIKGEKIIGVVELASFSTFAEREVKFISKGINLLASNFVQE